MLGSEILEKSIQINDGMTQTSADGANFAFDAKYGIMFCAYMPGMQGCYGESRGKISLSCFPASQPGNIRFVDVTQGNAEYVPNIIGLGDGVVRVIYEKDSHADRDHLMCYKDYNFLTDSLSEEKFITLGGSVPLSLSAVFAYLEENGCYNHQYLASEQSGACSLFKGEDGYIYGAYTTYLSEAVLYRSKDNMASLEFFAIYPRPVQYELDYRFFEGKIHALYRTNKPENSIEYAVSSDNGKTWSEPEEFSGSIQCRPRMLFHNGRLLLAYNYYNADTGNRPDIQQGRTSVRIHLQNQHGERAVVADLYSKCGIVNMALIDILGDLYMAYSTSELALEYQNYPKDNGLVRGKDAIRYVKLGDLTAQQSE